MNAFLIGPPLALLLLAAVAYAWAARGSHARRQRQAQISHALRPRDQMGPKVHGSFGRRPRPSRQPTSGHAYPNREESR